MNAVALQQQSMPFCTQAQIQGRFPVSNDSDSTPLVIWPVECLRLRLLAAGSLVRWPPSLHVFSIRLGYGIPHRQEALQHTQAIIIERTVWMRSGSGRSSVQTKHNNHTEQRSVEHFLHMAKLPVLKGSKLSCDLSSERGYVSDGLLSSQPQTCCM